MEVMDTMLGKWKMDPSATENFDAYATAVGFPDELKQKIKSETNVVAEMTRDGPTFTVVNNLGDQTETLVFKLGEKFKSSAFGVDSENEFCVEGNVVVGKHTIHGMTSTTRRYLKDGRLIIESEAKGVSMKNVMDRC